MFVTLEGIDRSGKTTQAALLAETLGPETLLIREPGGTEVGERVRSILKDPRIELASGAEVLLFNAARSQLVDEVIAPARAAGRDIVCDRFVDSTVAYQGIARSIDLDLLEQLNGLVVGECLPDITLLLRIEPEEAELRGQQRLAAGREDGADRFEGEGIDFQRLVAHAYEDLARRNPDRITVIDGTGPPPAVHERVIAAVRARL
jgi:dTMP kinase